MNANLFPRVAGVLFSSVLSRGNKSAVYLTFDDGPDPNFTPKVIDILAEHNAKATFFITAKKALIEPQLVRRICAQGHSIGTHGYFHRSMLFASKIWAREELGRSVKVIEDISGREIEFFRPPYGRFNHAVYQAARRMNLTIALWSLSLMDWQLQPAERLAENFRQSLSQGSIVLLHDSGKGVESLLEALPSMLAASAEKKFSFQTLDHAAL